MVRGREEDMENWYRKKRASGKNWGSDSHAQSDVYQDENEKQATGSPSSFYKEPHFPSQMRRKDRWQESATEENAKGTKWDRSRPKVSAEERGRFSPQSKWNAYKQRAGNSSKEREERLKERPIKKETGREKEQWGGDFFNEGNYERLGYQEPKSSKGEMSYKDSGQYSTKSRWVRPSRYQKDHDEEDNYYSR